MLALVDTPEDMYGKVMSWTDGMIVPGFRLCTDASEAEIADIERKMVAGRTRSASSATSRIASQPGFLMRRRRNARRRISRPCIRKGEIPGCAGSSQSGPE